MYTDLTNLSVDPESTIRLTTTQMNINRAGIVLVVDSERRLLGTITDGDVRRAMLANISLDEAVSVLLDRKLTSPYAKPITAPFSSDRTALLHILQEHSIRHLPLVDKDQRLVALVTLDEFISEPVPPLQAVIMAGGFGERLRPLTEDLPKPMLPVGGRPLIELIIQQLRRAGIYQVNLTTHYKSEAIEHHLGDGRQLGVEIRYVDEDQPLGTAGSLSLLAQSYDPLLVINGDILTRVDFRAMLDFHLEQQADMTVAVRQFDLRLPYGVVEINGSEIIAIAEKPVMHYFINAGIYLVSPEARSFVPKEQPYDMPDLIIKLMAEDRRVVSFPIHEYWLDIGERADYQQAQIDVAEGQA